MRRTPPAPIPSFATLVLSLVVLSAAAALARPEKLPPRQELVNFLLDPDLSQWLVGPVYFVATPAERREFLELESDAAAERFIEEFWKRHDPSPELFGNEVRELFDERVEEADRRFREQIRRGRSTDRGVIYTLYGEPERIVFDASPKLREPDLEVWIYPGDAAPGLDGKRPKKRYYFAEKDGETMLYTPRATRRITIPQ